MILKNKRELNTVLAALRYYQERILDVDQDIHDISSDGGTEQPLSSLEIDTLCEELNGGRSPLSQDNPGLFTLVDLNDRKELKGKVTQQGGSLAIAFAGYGVATMAVDDFGASGEPLVIELHDGRLRVLLWNDINQEDPTDIESLDGAAETLRKEP